MSCSQQCIVKDLISLPSKIIDSNGNYIDINYTLINNIPRISSVTDTIGRRISFVYENGVLSKITRLGFDGSTTQMVARLYYNFVNNKLILRHIIFPDSQTGWNLDYTSNNVIYRVQKLKEVAVNSDGSLSSLGHVVASTEYNYNSYSTYNIRTDTWLKNPSISNTDYETRQYHFYVTYDSTNQHQSVTKIWRDGDDTTIQIRKRYYTPTQRQNANWWDLWDDELILEEKVIANDIVYATKTLNWQKTTNNSARLTSEVLTNDAGQQSSTTYSYHPDPSLSNYEWTNIFHKIKEIKIYDFDGTLLKQTEFTYETDPAWTNRWLVNLVKNVKVYAAGQTVPASSTDFVYDSFSLSSCPGIINNDSGTPAQRGNLTSTISYPDPANTSTAITVKKEYDVAGNVVKTIDGKGNSATFNYADKFGLADSEARSNTSPGQLNGQSTFAYLTSVTNPLGFTAYTQYNYFTGLAVNSEDINGVISKMFYDSLNRPKQTVSAIGTAHESQSNINYDDANFKVETKSDLYNLNDNLSKSESFSDGLGRTIETRKYETGGYTKVETEYDSAGRIKKVSNPYRPWQNEQPSWTESKYDELDRIIEVKTITDGAKVITNYNGNAVTVIDQSGKQKRSITNALGQLVRVDEPDANNQLTLQTSYVSDVLGNLKTVTQGGQTRSFVYDSLSRLKTATYPELGNTVNGVYVPGTIQYTYDANGNLKTTTDARAIKTIIDYDSLNRVIKRCYSAPNVQTSATSCDELTNNGQLNSNTPTVSYTYEDNNIANSKGKLTRVSSSTSETRYTEFDVLGRVTASEQRTPFSNNENIGNAIPRTLSYVYNLSGALIEQTYPSKRVVKYTLDSNGELSTVQSKKNATAGFWNYADHFTYSSAGAVSGMRLGNGRWESTQFNERLQPKQIGLGTTPDNRTNLLKLNYEYGKMVSGVLQSGTNNGNLAKQTITVPTVGQTPGFTAVQYYEYDELNRIRQAAEQFTPNGGTQLTSWVQTFKYDRYGNRRFNTDDSSYTTTLPPGCQQAICNPTISQTNNRLDGYAFDNAGNMMVDAEGRQFVYDAENKQIEVKNSQNQPIGTYLYDGEGKRVKKLVGDETIIFVYDAFGRLVGEYATTIAPVSEAKVSYLTSDHLGSPRINTDQNGTVQARHDYHPFGEEIPRTNYGVDTVKQKFTEYERDGETGLDFAQARMYASKLGRFTTTDPLLASSSPLNPQSFNRYAYVLNTPLIMTDPTGEIPGDYYDKNGNWLFTDYEPDEKVYAVGSITTDSDGTTRYDDITLLQGITHTRFATTANIVMLEGKTDDSKEYLWIAHTANNRARASNLSIYNQLMTTYSSVSKSEKVPLSTKNSSVRANAARAGVIDVLSGGSDPTGGAEYWDGTDFLAWGLNSPYGRPHRKFVEYSTIVIREDIFNSYLSSQQAGYGNSVGYYGKQFSLPADVFNRAKNPNNWRTWHTNGNPQFGFEYFTGKGGNILYATGTAGHSIFWSVSYKRSN